MSIVNDEEGFTELLKLNLREELLVQGNPVFGISTVLEDGQIFKFDATDNSYVFAGITVDPVTGITVFDSSIEVPSGSIDFGEVITLGEGTNSLLDIDNISGENRASVRTVFDSEGSKVPQYFKLAQTTAFSVNSVFDTEITVNPFIDQITATIASQVNSLTLKTFAAMTNVRIRIVDVASGVVIRYMPSKASFESGEDGFDFITGDNIIDFISTAPSSPGIINLGVSPFRFDAGQLVDIEVRADAVSLLGNSAGVGFLEGIQQIGFDTELTTQLNVVDKLGLNNYATLNTNYASITATTAGWVVNFGNTGGDDTITSGQFTAGVASTSNPTVETDSASVFVATDIIQIRETRENNGVYEVLSHAANLLTIKGIGVTPKVEDFTRDQFVTILDSGVIEKFNSAVIRVGTDGLWEVGQGSQTGIVFEDLGIGMGATWGSIIGTLSDQADLQGELDDKMDISIYDPTAVSADAFSMGNMAETATAKVFTDTERSKLSGLGGDSIAFDANDAIYPASDPAVADSRNGHPIISFDDTVAENVLFNPAMFSSYSGGDISVDIDWVAETATTGGVTWGIEIERNAPGGNDIDSDSFDTQQTGTSATNATSGVITRTTITLTQAEADAIEASDAYRMRVQRVVGDGGDDMADDAQILRVGVRV